MTLIKVAYVIAERTSTDAFNTTLNVDAPLPVARASPKPSHHVLHVDDGVIHHHPDGDHQPGQHHHVDRGSRGVQHQDRRDQRQRDGDQADEGGTPLEQERDDDQHHQRDAEQHRYPEVVDRLLDEGGRPEDRGVDLDSGQSGLHLLAWPLPRPRVTSTVLAPRNFCTTSISPGPSSTTPSPISGPGSTSTFPRSAKPQHLAIAFHDRHLRELLRFDDRLDVTDVEPLTASLDKPAGTDNRTVGVAEQARLDGIG